MKKVFMTMLIFAVLILVYGCSNEVNANELKLGKYIEAENGLAWIILEENNEFIFIRYIATSYAPVGKFNIQSDKLILKVNDDEKYEFKIDGDKLIYESGTYNGDLISEGTVFQFSDKDE